MDSAFAQYSPLFTSGLLSGRNTPEHDSPSSSRSPSVKRRRQRDFHDSLPVTVNTATVSFHAAVRSTDSINDNAMFLTLMPRRRRSDEGRSFLSLDLAESQSMRSMSLRRKDTVTTRRTTFFGLGRSEPSSPVPGSPTPRLPELKFSQFALPPVTEPSPAPARASSKLRRPSRETLNLPSPKPAPSSSLPMPPNPLQRRRASNLTLTLSACLSNAMAVTSPTSSAHRASRSEPSLMSPSLCSSPILSPGQSYFLFSPTSPTPPPPTTASTAQFEPDLPRTPCSAPAAVPLRATPSFRSVASVNTRQRNRSAALAMLEGRARNAARPRNFMSMSDDEDEQEDEAVPTKDVQNRLLQVLQEEEDVVLPLASPSTSLRYPSQRIAACPAPRSESTVLGGSLSAKRASKESSRWSGSGSGSGSGSSSSPSKRSRRSTIESFLSPLANFIDLKDDDGASRSWRSFVEISS